METAARPIRFCTTSHGVRIAFAADGTGWSIVKTPDRLNHLELDPRPRRRT